MAVGWAWRYILPGDLLQIVACILYSGDRGDGKGGELPEDTSFSLFKLF